LKEVAMKVQTKFLVVFSIMGVLYSSSLHAIMPKLSLQELRDKTDCIMLGSTESMRSYWAKDTVTGADLIFTDVTVKPIEWFKTDADSTARLERIHVRILGGQVDSIGLYVSDSPEFEVGESVILFLHPEIGDQFKVFAWRLGKYTIIKNHIRENGLPVQAFIEKIKHGLKK